MLTDKLGEEKANQVFDIANEMSRAVEYVMTGALRHVERTVGVPTSDDVVIELVAGALTALHDHATTEQMRQILDQLDENDV